MSNVISPLDHHDRLWAAVQMAHDNRFEHPSPASEAAFHEAHAKWMRFFLKYDRYDPELRGVAKCQ